MANIGETIKKTPLVMHEAGSHFDFFPNVMPLLIPLNEQSCSDQLFGDTFTGEFILYSNISAKQKLKHQNHSQVHV